MIITLNGANFANNNINDLLNTFSVSYSGTGVTGTPRSIQKENGVATESLSATITIASNYTYESLTVRVGGNLLTAGTDYTVSGTGPVTLSIDAAKITGSVVVSVQTSSTGGDVVDPDEPVVPDEPETPTEAVWYVDHRNNANQFTSSVNIAGRGWCHVPGTPAYNAYVGKPVNTIGFFTTLASQNITIGKVVEKGGVDAMTEIATVVATNPSGTTKGFCSVTFPTVTLSEGECLVAFAQDDSSINFYYASSKGVTDANGIADGNFYGRVPKVYGSGTAWTSYTASLCLGMSVGYIPE